MERIIIAKAKKYAAVSSTEETAFTPDLLGDGSVGIYGFNSAGKLALISNTAATDNTAGAYVVNKADFTGKNFIIAVGTTKGPILSEPIVIADITRAKGFEYTAPVKTVKTITFTLPGTGNQFDTYTVIVNTHDASNPSKTVSKNYSVTGTYASVTLLNDAIRAKIAADDTAQVVGSGTSTLILTDKNFLSPMVQVVASTTLFGSTNVETNAVVTVVDTTAFNAGSGYYTQVANIEREMQIAKGYWDNRETTTVKPAVRTVDDQAYDLYFIDQVKSETTNTDTFKQQPSNTVLAFPDGDYDAASEGQGAVVDILTVILGTKSVSVAASGDAETLTIPVSTGKFEAGANDGA